MKKNNEKTNKENAQKSLSQFRKSEYIPRTIVKNLGYSHSVVNEINSKNGEPFTPKITYDEVIKSAKDITDFKNLF